jgi:phosphoribosylformylglycinamidine synthase
MVANSSFTLTLFGANAHSAFRLQNLLEEIHSGHNELSSIVGLESRWIYWVNSQQPITHDQQGQLEGLLGDIVVNFSVPDNSIVVAPRLGTISPWASKATDIAHNCGLAGVHRIERGLLFTVQTKTSLGSLARGFFSGSAAGSSTSSSSSSAAGFQPTAKLSEQAQQTLINCLHDRMVETINPWPWNPEVLFQTLPGKPMAYIGVLEQGIAALEQANHELGLALSDDEIAYLENAFKQVKRNPTDVELMMFAQANSEHCRHKIFNADWTVDGQVQPLSLFGMIRNTHKLNPQGTEIAYSDNSAVLSGSQVARFYPQQQGMNGFYEARKELTHSVLKVETHNHPTAIAPFSGAATGAGGEIRDEGATGRGAKPKFGMTGFSVSHLRIPGFAQAWEANAIGAPDRIATPLSIMIDGPIGGAAFNNEFGRPNLAGYFRSYEQLAEGQVRGYHKPIMIAGGVGDIQAEQTHKLDLPAGSLLIQLGGPGMRIGMGGGAASSMATGTNQADLDFDSVQRGNPEIERRAQEVIDRCWQLGKQNPILSIHDVGAGGISNAFPELAHGSGRGARFDLTKVPLEESGLSPAEIWCNESQERYVLAIAPESLPTFDHFCRRERCPFAVVGVVSQEQQLIVTTETVNAVDMSMDVLLGKPPKMLRNAQRRGRSLAPVDLAEIDLSKAIKQVIQFPAVASKSFLITIGDRSVGGLCSRDQMVGPWQVPVADCAVGLMDFEGYAGQALAIGERTPLAVINSAAAARMALAESITNIAAAPITDLSQIKLSANWMAACGEPGEDADLFDAVHAVGMELCPALGISIPVGKDSLSMRTVWNDAGTEKKVSSPVSLVISAFAPVDDARLSLTPQLRSDCGDTVLIFIDLAQGRQRMGGSVLAQVNNQVGNECPDLQSTDDLKQFFAVIQRLNREGKILAYHDRSDGGLFATVSEMAFAGHCGVALNCDLLTIDPYSADWGDFKIRVEQVAVQRNELTLKALFNEELGAVIQVRANERDLVMGILREVGLSKFSNPIGKPNTSDEIEIYRDGKLVWHEPRTLVHAWWSETSYQIARLRDNPECAKQEYESLAHPDNRGLAFAPSFDTSINVAAPFIANGVRPRVAILRDQGVNSHVEMAAAMTLAGFDCFDVHMTDLETGRHRLTDFRGLVVCGGFAYGDVLGAGAGWAKSILFNPILAEQFSVFFNRPETFSLGVCNGCQMLSQLKSIIPGAQHWPSFARNLSEQYEARFSNVEILASPSIFFSGMVGSRLPIVVAHGEGRTVWATNEQQNAALAAMRFIEPNGEAADAYPFNPNGSAGGLTAFTSADGRATIMMPHAERVFRAVQMSWSPRQVADESAWMRMFRNARAFCG